MKKFTFLAMFIALGAVTFTCCQKKNTAAEPEQQVEKTAMTFYAVPQSSERTELDGALNSVWTGGDQLRIFTLETIETGGDIFTLSKGAGTNYGEFTGESTESEMYIAMYPADIASTDEEEPGKGFYFDLPKKQKYAVNSYATNSVPVFAQSESKELVFNNTVGLLRLGIKLKSGDNTVSSMILKDKNSSVKLWGKFIVGGDYSLSYYGKSEGEDGDNTITMDLGTTGVNLSSSDFTYFYFYLPKNALATGFTVEMADKDGKTATIDYSGTDKKIECGWGNTLEQSDVEFTAAPVSGVFDACGNKYTTTEIGEQTWLVENMHCNKYSKNSDAYKEGRTGALTTSDLETVEPYYYVGSMSDDYGYYYNWAAAVGINEDIYRIVPFTGNRQGICPDGYHVPTWDDYYELREFIRGEKDYYVAPHLKSNTSDWSEGNHYDTYGFTALPAGASTDKSGQIEIVGIGDAALFWTADPDESESYNERAHIWELAAYSDYFEGYDYMDKEQAISVRCVKD